MDRKLNIEQAKLTVSRYRTMMQTSNKLVAPDDRSPSLVEAREHLAYMLDEMREMLVRIEDFVPDPFPVNRMVEVRVEQEMWEKYNRWLGFAQGLMWVLGIYYLGELKDHNRPREGKHRTDSHHSGGER